MAKLALVQEGIALDRGVIVAVSLAASLLTLFSMTKIWGGVFWGEPTEASGESSRGMTVATGVIVALSLGIALLAGPLAELTGRAAADLVDPGVYVQLVLGSAR